MPIFEYRCDECGTTFEKLVLGSSARVACPRCSAAEVTRRPSSFGTAGTEKKVSSQAGCSGCRKGSCAGCG